MRVYLRKGERLGNVLWVELSEGRWLAVKHDGTHRVHDNALWGNVGADLEASPFWERVS